jgi:large subunit ribosomal protein L21
MYAVIQSGGKQHRVSKGEQIQLEKLDGAEGDKITFDDVLLVKDGDRLLVGTPNVDGANVSGKIVAHGKDKKINVFTYKRRKNYARRLGHRQQFTCVEITTISAPKE